MEPDRQEMELKKIEQSLEIEALCEENSTKLAEAKLHEVSASHDLLEKVSQTNVDEDTKSNQVEQCVNGSTSECDQPPLVGDIEAEEKTRTGLMASDYQPQLPSTSNKLTFVQTQSQTQQPDLSIVAPTQSSLTTSAPRVVVPSTSNSTPLSMLMASQT